MSAIYCFKWTSIKLKHERSICDREQCKMMTLVSSLNQKRVKFIKPQAPVQLIKISVHSSPSPRSEQAWKVDVIHGTRSHAWLQTQASTWVPGSCLSVLHAELKISFRPLILKSSVLAQWNQTSDSTANGDLKSSTTNNVLRAWKMSSEPTGCPKVHSSYNRI